jgi:DNA-binding beta-propeller fold protein YncE
MKLNCRSIMICLLLTVAFASAQTPSYKPAGSISIGGTGGWDYLTVDPDGHRLYVSHTAVVEVINLGSQKPAGKISGLTRVHGIAIAKDLGLGFISDGGANEVVQFGLKNLDVQKKIKTGTNPDGILYDEASKRVFAFNGRSSDATVINASDGSVAGTIKLGGKPEFPVSDGKGTVFVNVEDKSEIIKINSKSLTADAHWPLAPCESPSGLAIDRARERLFSVCENKMMAITDAKSGKVVGTPAIGEGADAAAYDPSNKLAFSSNGESGTLTIVSESGKGRYATTDVKTSEGARTMALDTSTHKIYLATASFGAAPQASANNPRPRRAIQPGSFKVLVLERQ